MTHHAHPECPFCLDNGRVVELARTQHAFIAQALRDGEPLTGAYLAIPVPHVTDEPPWFVRAVDTMVKNLGLNIDNRSVNLSKSGGRTLPHFHMWLLDRTAIGDGWNLGMFGVIERCQELSGQVADLRGSADARSFDLATSGLPT